MIEKGLVNHRNKSTPAPSQTTLACYDSSSLMQPLLLQDHAHYRLEGR